MDAILICDADTLVSVVRDSSKTRLMGTNIHPSRKTEIEKREETEEYNMIRSTSNNSLSLHGQTEDGDLLDICTNAEIISHDLLTRDTNAPTGTGTVEQHSNSVNAEEDSFTDSLKTPKTNQLSSISSNLNLIEGDLPEDMLENFDIPSGPITPVIAGVIMNVLKQGGRLSPKSVHKILRISYKFLSELPNTTRCTVGTTDRLTTVGDIHGEYNTPFLRFHRLVLRVEFIQLHLIISRTPLSFTNLNLYA